MRRWVLVVVLLLAAPASAAPHPGFGWPLAGTPVVDRGFDPPQTLYGGGHRGVDLRAGVGQPVLAAGAGVVSYAGLLAGRGVVTVTHPGGLRTTYEPVTAVVRVGQVVARGSVLGHVATRHASCLAGTSCLHWGLVRGDTYLDPLTLVVTTPARLLPVGTDPSGSGPPQVEVAPVRSSGRWSGPARPAGAAVATGALLLGIGLLARRPTRPTPSAPMGPGGPPVDLMLERRRRRAA
jgi:murein DD-endopeptidase MepM/ murein hydrolase activator NlpD